MPHALRPYQETCLRAHAYHLTKPGAPLFVVPTGGGKSLIIAEFIRMVLTAQPHARVLMLTHVKELVEQNHAELEQQTGIRAGICSAGLGKRDTRSAVLFASVQTAINCIDKIGSRDFVLIDEAHLVPKRGMGRYVQVLDRLRKINPGLKLIGYTATPFRLDSGFLHEGEGAIFTHVAHEVDVAGLVQQGYLAPLRAVATDAVIDASGVKMTAGEFNQRQLEEAATEGDLVRRCVAETHRIAVKEGRKSWLVFGTLVRHAEMLREEFLRLDVDCETITGETPKAQRDETIQRFKRGDLTCLVNVGVLTTGFNAPRIDLMAVMRPTASTALYVQIMGRGMRTHPGKADCIVLDFGTNVMRHGPINRVRVKTPNQSDGPKVRTCPECRTINPVEAETCEECGTALVDPEPRERKVNHDHQAAGGEIIAWGGQDDTRKTHHVVHWIPRRHKKQGKPDSVRIDYICPPQVISEWLCFEHQGRAEAMACKAWRDLGGGDDTPMTTDEALARFPALTRPHQIDVDHDGRYPRIIRRHLPATTAQPKQDPRPRV